MPEATIIPGGLTACFEWRHANAEWARDAETHAIIGTRYRHNDSLCKATFQSAFDAPSNTYHILAKLTAEDTGEKFEIKFV